MTSTRRLDHRRRGGALLGVSRPTLYAYVSRGFVRSQPLGGATRERAYARDDVERLRQRTEERREPDKAAARALQWGMPILESSITLIDGDRLYYRGHDAAELARTRTVEEVAALIWTGSSKRRQRRSRTSDPRRPLRECRSARARSRLLPRPPRATRSLWTCARGRRANGLAHPPPAGECGGRPVADDTTLDDALARNWRVGAAAPD